MVRPGLGAGISTFVLVFFASSTRWFLIREGPIPVLFIAVYPVHGTWQVLNGHFWNAAFQHNQHALSARGQCAGKVHLLPIRWSLTRHSQWPWSKASGQLPGAQGASAVTAALREWMQLLRQTQVLTSPALDAGDMHR